jgi:hypothetical protein
VPVKPESAGDELADLLHGASHEPADFLSGHIVRFCIPSLLPTRGWL